MTDATQQELPLTQARRLSQRQDIINVILSRGDLTKDEIKLMWGLDEEAYAHLKADLSEEKLIEPGSRGSGGFAARFKKRPKAPDETVTAPILGTAWERASADRLATLLSHAELEELLGDLVYTIRRARAQATGEDRRGNKSELAAALVTQHGIDLFINRDVRTLIAKKCKVDSPGRWHPGKGTALRFVVAVGFPEELAGIPAEETPPDFEYLEGRVDLKALQPFQLEVQSKLLLVLRTSAAARAIVTLPTGAGKTRVAVDSVRDWLTERWVTKQDGIGNTVIWLAHTEELCEQAYACFREVWQSSSNVCPLLLFRFWGPYTRDILQHRETLITMSFRPTVLISTPQRIVNLLEERIQGAAEVIENLEGTTGLIVIDEAHRAAAPSYRTIMQAFESTRRRPAMIGLTATPFRQEYSATDPEAGTRELRELFGQIIEPYDTLGDNPRAKLEEAGFLAQPVWSEIKTSTLLMAPHIDDPEHITEGDIEKIDRALKIRADNPTRRMVILEHLEKICEDPSSQIIYFGPSVLDAECMAFLLRQRQIAAAFVSGETRDVTRRKIISDFKANRTKVLCNCEVLTTGFDAPKVTHVIMARPTVSQVLYEQMIGRGLRGPKFGGTETCVIIDLEDKYRTERPKLGYQQFRDLWKREAAH